MLTCSCGNWCQQSNKHSIIDKIERIMHPKVPCRDWWYTEAVLNVLKARWCHPGDWMDRKRLCVCCCCQRRGSEKGCVQHVWNIKWSLLSASCLLKCCRVKRRVCSSVLFTVLFLMETRLGWMQGQQRWTSPGPWVIQPQLGVGFDGGSCVSEGGGTPPDVTDWAQGSRSMASVFEKHLGYKCVCFVRTCRCWRDVPEPNWARLSSNATLQSYAATWNPIHAHHRELHPLWRAPLETSVEHRHSSIFNKCDPVCTLL